MYVYADMYIPPLYEKTEMDKQVREELLKSFLFGTRQKQTQTSLREN